MRRRTYLAAATAAAMAGCTDGDDSGATGATTDDDPPPLEGPDADGTIDDFADFGAWSVLAGRASLVDDEASVGDRSVLLAADGDDEAARIVRELPEPVDFSGVSPGLAVATAETATPIVQLFDGDGNAIEFRATVHGGTDLRRCNFGVTGVESEANLREITEIHVAVVAAGDAERELRLDDLHLVSRPDDGLVTLQFDGGDESIHGEALPVLEEYGFSATAFVPTDLIRASPDHDGDRMTESQLEELADAGWTIGSYTANGRLLPELGPDEQAAQLADAREWLEEAGYGDGARFVSYPAGRYDDDALELVGETYDLGFAAGQPVQGRVVDPVRYPRVVDPDAAEELLERTADLGGITGLCYHGLEGDAIDRFEETMAFLDALVAEGDLEVVGPDAIASEYAAETG
ncbi:polysaccharide deacetylase family protein [Haloterrigena salinisoli]|uniref:polysaccharide deacetylase family protein n=1 Tax=Haloterrigena salinisoli TaxID=3132747 RepID=UPI0030CAF9D8